MQTPISIAPLLWHHQTERKANYTITHGKGRKGIIIRTRPVSFTHRAIRLIKSVFRGQA